MEICGKPTGGKRLDFWEGSYRPLSIESRIPPPSIFVGRRSINCTPGLSSVYQPVVRTEEQFRNPAVPHTGAGKSDLSLKDRTGLSELLRNALNEGLCRDHYRGAKMLGQLELSYRTLRLLLGTSMRAINKISFRPVQLLQRG